ncbi:ASKHA domain-containing protein [Geomesophilobacter sediminis]|uniref:DUF4445 domain-containing protein n=1 Tax=Geomesophilobacter sediminis TaxID=2798584 RepID=A0A8J7S9Q2_9BACT|nr:ASKHA domain-containing protein [Geomesophilobacter sediminis]MBJ6727011.1 DUF4445 domain-containing protein [Geomesophilobacter sediminis]
MTPSHIRKLAAAFDLGTTTIAASLLDLGTGERLGVCSAMNPQRQWGSDVLARIGAAADPVELSGMQMAAAAEMERMTRDLLQQIDASPEHLSGVAVAANSAMEEIALGLYPKSLAAPPFRPSFSAGQSVTTAKLGWDLDVPAYLFPLPGGFVGGDLLAFLHGLAETPRPRSLYLDLGTNAEIALYDGNGFLATSAAAGPAFEGGNLKCGTAALPGAISSVEISGDRLAVRTIPGAPPHGICGSGVLEAVSALRGAGIIDATGRIVSADEIPSNLANRRTDINGVPAFVLHRDAKSTVYLDQEDIRALQLAKGALRAGIEVLLSRAHLSADDLSEVVLTGSFGAVLSPAVLKSIGIFTEKMVIITGFVREGALAGVERFLTDPGGREQVERLAEAVRVIPLSGTPLFEQLFLANLDFP